MFQYQHYAASPKVAQDAGMSWEEVVVDWLPTRIARGSFGDGSCRGK